MTMTTFDREIVQELVAAAEEEAARTGVAATIAVLDDAGALQAFIRMDGAALGGTTLAPAKALAAVSFGVPSAELREMANSDLPFAVSLTGSAPEIAILGGGRPIYRGGNLVGALGVSGGSEDQDDRIARVATERLG